MAVVVVQCLTALGTSGVMVSPGVLGSLLRLTLRSPAMVVQQVMVLALVKA